MRNLLRSLAVVSVLLVAGCSGGGAESTAGEDTGAQEEAGDGFAGGAEGEAAEEPAAPEAVGDLADEQVFVVRGSLSMIVEEPARAATEAARLVEAVDGHVQERVEEGGEADEFASAYLVVRIPSDEVTETMERIRELGEVVDSSQVTEEVTDQVRDLEARIRALEISIGRLEALLERAGTIPEVVEAERVLTDRQSELEVLLSQQASLADDVALSTFRIDMWSEGAEPDEPPTGFLAGLVDGWNSLVAALTALSQAVGALLPWLLFFALIAALVIAARGALGRRRTATAPSSVSEQGAGTHPTGPAVPAGGAPGAGPTTSLPANRPSPGTTHPVPPVQQPADQPAPAPAEPGPTEPPAATRRSPARRRPSAGDADS